MKKLLPVLSLALVSSANAASVNGFDLNAYGFIKASAMYADEALASYNNINLSAPTHAVGKLPSRPQDKSSRMSFQTQQSRVGVNLKKEENLSAKLEFDFIDFNKSSPTTQMVPRVRIASVTYNFDAHNKMIVGQDWDLFSPVTTYTFDYVGLYFMAGNVGFMRQQFQFLHDSGDWEFGAAVGMAGNNPGVTDNDLEAGKSPTYSLRATRKLTNGRIGLSGIYARLAYNTDNGDARDFTTDAYGANAFYEQTMENGWAVKSELYYGQNLNNIGALSIGKGTATSNVKEYGGTLTATKKVSEKGMMFGGAGLAKADEKGQVTPLAITNNVITAPGVTSNFLSRIGYDHAITKDFSWLTEASRYETESRISASKYQVNIAYSLETGFVLRF